MALATVCLLTVGCNRQKPTTVECAPRLDRYTGEYREAEHGAVPDGHVSGTNPGGQLQVNFPPNAHSGPERLSYWLTGDEALEAKVELALGPGTGLPDAVRIQVGLFVDGVLTSTTIAGNDVKTATVDMALGETASLEMKLESSQIGDGAHSAALLGWMSDGKPWASWAFTILKNGYAFPPFKDDGEVPVISIPVEASTGGVYDDATGLPLYGAYTPPVDGKLQYRAVVGTSDRACPKLPVNIAVLAILDGDQVSLSEAPFKAAQTTSEAFKMVRFDLQALPTGPGQHYLMFWALPGFGQYFEGSEGGRAPWAGLPYRITVATWGS